MRRPLRKNGKKRSAKRKPLRRKASYKRLKKTIRNVVRAEAEDKMQQFYQNALPISCGSVVNVDSTCIFAVAPRNTSISIVNGSTRYQRVGQKIRTKRAYIDITLCPAPYDAGFNPAPRPQNGMILFLYDKTQPQAFPTLANNGDFFVGQGGNITGTFNFNQSDLMRAINTNRYAILKKVKFKLGYSQAAGTGFNAAAQAYSNNDFPYQWKKRISLTKHMCKVMKFNDLNSGTPTNRGLWMFVYAQGADLNSAPVAAYTPMFITYNLMYQYEDI